MSADRLTARAKRTSSVQALIVTYNSADFIGDLLQDLKNQQVDCLVYDNNSTDRSVEVALNHLPRSNVIASDRNLGFAAALNHLIDLSTAPSILVMNPDAIFKSGGLQLLEQELAQFPSTGIAAPVVHHAGGTHRVISAGFLPDLRRVACHYSGLSRLSSKIPQFRGQYLLESMSLAPRTDVEWATGACLLIRRQVIVEIGKFSERWFMYAEDIEFCARVRRSSNWHITLVRESEVVHAVGASAPKLGRPSTTWLLNLFDFYRTELSPNPVASFAWAAFVATSLGARVILTRLLGRTVNRQLATAAIDLFQVALRIRGPR